MEVKYMHNKELAKKLRQFFAKQGVNVNPTHSVTPEKMRFYNANYKFMHLEK
jgi:hypothetical protein